MQETFFDVRGLRMHARVRGDGPLTLLLHGWLDHAGSFDLLAPLLPGRTAALDFRGHGDSAWVGPGGFYHFIDYLADIDGAIEALSPKDPVRIVGHSMGAASALLYVAARPERVTHLTLIDALPITVPSSEVPGRVTEHLRDLRGSSRARRPVKSVEDAAARLMRNNASLTQETALILAKGGTGPVDGGLAWKWDPLLRVRSPLPVTEDVVKLLCAQVKLKPLVLRAEKGILPPEAELRARLPMLPFELHTVPGTGHHVHLDKPEEVARLILAAG
ncbi:MAG TPA: alpha/beta hydrolase [Myxococcales bacterium]|nr:alpha/beta hydrolase [Myxococcales bacterium]